MTIHPGIYHPISKEIYDQKQMKKVESLIPNYFSVHPHGVKQTKKNLFLIIIPSMNKG